MGYLCTDVEFMKDCVTEKEPWYGIEFGKIPTHCMRLMNLMNLMNLRKNECHSNGFVCIISSLSI